MFNQQVNKEKSCKVCIITSVHYPFDNRIFYKQAKTLAKADYEVVLIAPHEQDEIIDGIKIRAVPKPANRIVRMFLITFLILKKAIQEKAKIYHFHDPELIPAGLLLKLLGKRVIYDVHENYPKLMLSKEYLPKFMRRFAAVIVNLIEKWASKSFDAIITATDEILNNFSSHKRVSMLRNFPIINLKELPKNNNSITKKEESTLIYFGEIEKSRGITQIIQALEYISPKKDKIASMW